MPKQPIAATPLLDPIDTDENTATSTGVSKSPVAAVPISKEDVSHMFDFTKAGDSRPNLSGQTSNLNLDLPRGFVESLPVLGGVVGSLGGPKGSAVGGFSGRILEDTIKNLFPGRFGQPEYSFLADVTGTTRPFTTALVNAAQEGIVQGGAQKAIEVGSTLGGEAIPWAFDRIRGVATPSIKQRLAARFFTPHPFIKDPEDVNAAIQVGLEPSTHQTTGSPMAGTLEFGPGKTELQVRQQSKLQELFNRQQATIRGESYTPVSNTIRKGTQEYAAPAREGALANYEQMRAEENSWFNRFKGYAEQNAVELQEFKGFTPGAPSESPIIDPNTGQPVALPQTPQTETIRVAGPIYLDKAKALAEKVLPELQTLKSSKSYEGLPPEFRTEVNSLYNNIESLVRPTQVVSPVTGELESIYVKPWETIKKLRTEIEEVTKGQFRKTYEQAGLQNIKTALGEDIKDSIKAWPNAPEEAAYTLERANMATKSRNYVFDNKVAKLSMFKEGDIRRGANLSEFFQRGYKNQDTARELVNAMGYGNRKYVAGDYLDSVLVKQGASPESIISELEDKNSVSRVFLNARERAGIMQWARASRAVAPSPTTPGNFALVYNGARFALTIATTPFTGIGPRQIYAGAGLGAITMGRGAMRDILLNPETAKLAARLSKIPPTSIEAQAASKALLKAIQGTRVLVSFEQGATQTGTVTPQGKVAMDQSQP